MLRIRHRPDLQSASTLAACDLVSHFLFGVGTYEYDRLAVGDEAGRHVVQVGELAVPVGVLGPSVTFALACSE